MPRMKVSTALLPPHPESVELERDHPGIQPTHHVIPIRYDMYARKVSVDGPLSFVEYTCKHKHIGPKVEERSPLLTR